MHMCAIDSFCSLVNIANYYNTLSCQDNPVHYLLTYNQMIKGA
jgi:hypothetical protein